MKYLLKELREQKGETQAETAKALGIARTTYSRWERDLSNVSFSKALALARYFNVRLSEIKLKAD